MIGNYSLKRLLVTVVFFLIVSTSLQATYAEVEAPPPTVSRAQADNSGPCIPVDMVMMIDQSASNTNTDPRNLRVDVAKAVVDQLFVHAAINCEGIVTHRLAIVGFNDQVSLLLPPTEIFVPDATDNSWLDQQTEIRNSLQSDASGQTNIAAAILLSENSAVNILERLPSLGDEVIREQFVLLITDGYPCTNAAADGDLGGTDYCASPRWIEHYFYANNGRIYVNDPSVYYFDLDNGLVAAIAEEVPNDTRVSVISFTNDTPVEAVSQAWTEIAESRTGEYVELSVGDGYSQVTDATTSILRDVLKTTGTNITCNEVVTIDPYSSTTIVSAIRPNVGTNVIIIQPNGEEITPATVAGNPNRIEYAQLETYERYIIADPIPGLWSIRSNDEALCDQISAEFSTVAFEASIALPDTEAIVVERDAPYYQNTSQALVELRVIDKRFGVALVEREGYPLLVCGTITGPVNRRADGIVPQTYPADGCIDFEYRSPGLWVATEPLPAPYQGSYELEIDIKTDSFDRNRRIELYNSGPLPYTAALPVDIEMELLAPLATQADEPHIWALNEFDPDTNTQSPNSLAVRVQIKDDSGNPIPASEVFRGNENSALEAVLEGPVDETITLRVDPADPSVLVGVLRDGQTQLDPAGNYNLTVRVTDDAQANYNNENYTFDFSAPTQAIEGVELVGVLLEITSWPDQVLYNTIANGQRQNVKIPIEVRLLDQDGEELTATQVFGSSISPDSLIQAQLTGPNNAVVGDALMLRYDAATNRFQGDLLNQLGTIGDPGSYVVSVRFADTALLSAEQAREYTLVTTANRAITDTVSRIERDGVSVELAEVSVNGLIVPNGGSAQLNHLTADSDGEFEQEELPVTVQVRLVDLDGNTYLNFDEVFRPATNIDNVLTVTANGPNGAASTTVLTPDLATGLWTGRLFTDPRRGNINAEGDYTFTITLVESAFSTDALAAYELLTDTASFTMRREELIGVQLELLRLGDRDEGFDPQPNTPGVQLESVESIPLHNTMSEAMGFILWLGDDDPRAVPFQFAIKDTNGTLQNWLELVEDDTLTIDQVISISVVSEDGSETIPITNLQSERIAGDYVITGEIDDEATSSGTYRLIYGLQSTLAGVTPATAIFAPDITNLSNEQRQVAFSREEVGITENPTLNPLFWNIIAGIIWTIIFLIIFHALRLNVPAFPIPQFNAFMSGKMEVKLNRAGQDEPTRFSLNVPFRFFGTSTRKEYVITPTNDPAGKTTVKIVVKRAGWEKPPQIGRTGMAGRPLRPGVRPSAAPIDPQAPTDKRLRRYVVKVTAESAKTGKSEYQPLIVFESQESKSPHVTAQHFRR